MESIFNQIKKLMQGDQNQPLPPELDWSNMKDGIFDKIQSKEQEEAAQSKNTDSRKRVGLFLILFFELALALFFIYPKMTADQMAEAQDAVRLPETDLNKGASNDTEKANLTNQVEQVGDSLREKDLKTDVKDRLITYRESGLNQDSKKSEIPNLVAEQLSGDPHSHEKALKNREYVFPPIPALQALPIFFSTQITTEKIKYSNFDIQQADSIPLPRIQHRQSPDQLILEGGIIFWDEGYGNTEPERAQYETPLSSFQLQGHYMKRLKRDYFIMAGLQYQQLESRFDYNSTIQDYQITLKDTIIQVRKNLLTGEQTLVRGDVVQYVEAERRVVHYNKTKLLKASIGLGKSWRFHSFQTDVYLGGALNGLVQNQGRTFHQDTILDYNGSSNSLFQNQLTADGFLGARVHYFLTRNMGITTGVQVQKSLMNWSNQENINFFPASFSLQLGLSYSL